MNIIFIGLGSIGKRHLFNLVEVLEEMQIPYHIDALRSSDVKLENSYSKLIRNQFYDFKEVGEGYDIAFITNPTSEHLNAIKILEGKAKNFFVEKPITNNVDIHSEIFEAIEGVCYTACPLRYTKIMAYVKDFVQKNKVISYRAHSSSYLPEWRPEKDYRSSYSAVKSLGGGIELDLIHEIDYLGYLFGPPEEIMVRRGKFSDLEIETNDLAIYILGYKDKVGTVYLDYFGRYPSRGLVLCTNEVTLECDFIEGEIFSKGKRIDADVKEERNSCYLKEMRAFIEMVVEDRENFNPSGAALNTLRIALGEMGKDD